MKKQPLAQKAPFLLPKKIYPCYTDNMTEDLKQQLKKKLEATKVEVEAELKKIADKDPEVAGDYDTRFPDMGSMQSSDENAFQFAEYERTLPIEHALELRLQAVNQALNKIKQGTYGTCEICNEPIEKKRLDIYPDVKTCMKCKTVGHRGKI